MEKVEILKEQIRKKDELLELVVALAAKNIALEARIEDLEEKLADKHPLQDLIDLKNNLKEEEMPESLQKGIDEYDYEAACLQAEIEEAREREEIEQTNLDHSPSDEDEDDSDFTHPPYEHIVDPEFDRGFDMAYDKALGDIIYYLKSIRNKGGWRD